MCICVDDRRYKIMIICKSIYYTINLKNIKFVSPFIIGTIDLDII